jgi:Mn2+/Fe2+ NRAMP family transporter
MIPLLGKWRRFLPYLGGIAALLLLVAALAILHSHLTMRRSIMAGFTLPPLLLVMGWLATATMAVTTVAMVASWFD